MRWLLALALLLVSGPARAHGDEAVHGPDGWLLLAIGLPPVLYGFGVARLWRAAGIGRGTRAGRVACFALGWAALALALASPLHALAERSFAAHMTIHLLLMGVAAPLLVLARPVAPFAWALPGPGRLLRPVMATLRPLGDPFVATGLQIAVLSTWHVPALFDRAVADRGMHVLQHLTFTSAALVFWWSMLERCRRGRREGVAVACLFLTMPCCTARSWALSSPSHPGSGTRPRARFRA
jgi:cytochrome c oxidase assembly factor CtaG